MAPQPAEHSCRGSPIRWYAPASLDMRRELARWCATVGPALIEPLPSVELGRTAAAGPLTVVSWNVNVGGGDLLEFLSGELDLDCAVGAPRPGPRFSHFALLVQEAHRLSEDVPAPEPGAPLPLRIDPPQRPGPMLDIAEVAARCGLAMIYVPSARNGDRGEGARREDKGNAILASVPISDFIAIEVPLEASRKVVVGASLALPDGGQLRVVSVHLDVAAGLARILISGNSWRLEQALTVIEALELTESAIATLVAGDFNVWSADESALKVFRREFPESPAWTGRPTRGAFAPDHLFFAAARDGRVQLVPGSYRRLDERFHSDHYALSTQVMTRQ